MHQDQPRSRPRRAQGLCKVTVLVPEDCAEGIRQFAQELSAGYRVEPAYTRPKWQSLSPSAELMVSPDRSARCAVCDTRIPGADRFRWTVAALGQLDPIAEGRTENRAEGRSLAETAVAVYFANRTGPSGGESVWND
jgi:hypothetical protein